MYNEKNEAYKVFQLARHVRELVKNITDGTYYVRDMDVLKEVSALLIDAHKKLLSMKTPSSFPELKGQDLRYKTLKELSNHQLLKVNCYLQNRIYFSL